MRYLALPDLLITSANDPELNAAKEIAHREGAISTREVFKNIVEDS